LSLRLIGHLSTVNGDGCKEESYKCNRGPEGRTHSRFSLF
jgi:hypothetical protein